MFTLSVFFFFFEISIIQFPNFQVWGTEPLFRANLLLGESPSRGLLYLAVEKAKTPAHKGVPFWQVNGASITYPNSTNKEDLVKAVCDAYTGTPKPAACASPLSVGLQGISAGSDSSFEAWSCEAKPQFTLVV